MSTNKPKEFTCMTDNEIQQWLSNFDTFLFDCDGVLWYMYNVFDGVVEVVNTLKKLGKRVNFITNNSTRTRHEFKNIARRLGFEIELDEIFCTSYMTAKYLKDQNFVGTVYVIGSSCIKTELDAMDIANFGVGPDLIDGKNPIQALQACMLNDPKDINAVIVGVDEHFSIMKITRALNYLTKPECLFIGTNSDPSYALEPPFPVIPTDGTFLATIEVATGRKAVIMGKPDPHLCDFIMKNQTIVPEKTLFVGDQLHTDMKFGNTCGFQTLLVETGSHSKKDVDEYVANDPDDSQLFMPNIIIPKVADLLPYLIKLTK